MDDTDALALAARQGGVISRTQALELGHTRGSIDRRVRSKRWLVMGRGIYRLLPAVDEADVLRGAMVALPHPVVSHTSAGRLLGLEGIPAGPPTLTVAQHTTHVFAGASVRRSAAGITEEERTTAGGFVTTGPARTLVDLAADMIPQAWDRVAQTTVVSGRTSLREVQAVADRVCGQGRPGSVVVREFLANETASWSALERRAAALLLPLGAVPQFRAPWDHALRIDFAFPEERLGIELDSRRWHSTSERFESDRHRDREALRVDWRLVRATWRDVTIARDDFLRLIIDLRRR
ncbi:MAG: type IV toxin-antitoxin system AbiEi family antitoxin domain-containing protein [Acidimicrobiia bacterium]